MGLLNCHKTLKIIRNLNYNAKCEQPDSQHKTAETNATQEHEEPVRIPALTFLTHTGSYRI